MVHIICTAVKYNMKSKEESLPSCFLCLSAMCFEAREPLPLQVCMCTFAYYIYKVHYTP